MDAGSQYISHVHQQHAWNWNPTKRLVVVYLEIYCTWHLMTWKSPTVLTTISAGIDGQMVRKAYP
jgi:hypothetical protein